MRGEGGAPSHGPVLFVSLSGQWPMDCADHRVIANPPKGRIVRLRHLSRIYRRGRAPHWTPVAGPWCDI